MCSTNSGRADAVRLLNCKLWLSKRPKGMKGTGPLYLSIINHPQSANVWYTKIRMGQNTFSNIMKSMASCIRTNKKLTIKPHHEEIIGIKTEEVWPRNCIWEITGHASESSLVDYDEMDEDLRKKLCMCHIISGYKEVPNENTPNDVSNQNTANEASNQETNNQRAPLVPI